MMLLRWALALGVGGFLLFFGYLKLSGEAFIFPYIEYLAEARGLPFAGYAFPLVNWIVGGIEVLAGLLVILPFTRDFGSWFSVLPFGGAVATHLSPYLGINTPVNFAIPRPVDALQAGEGFVRTDFTEQTGIVLFLIAVGMLIISLLNAFVQNRT